MRALEIARRAVAEHNAANGGRGGVTAVARKIGVSRPALSLFLAGRYPAQSTAAIEARILRALEGRVQCPFLATDIAAEICRDHALRPMPTSSPRALRHWHACQTCRHRLQGGERDADHTLD